MTTNETLERTRSLDRLYRDTYQSAVDQWGSGWVHLSNVQQRAFVAQHILFVLTMQDEHISAETVRDVMNGLYDRFNDDKRLWSQP